MEKPIADDYEEMIKLIDPLKPIRCYRNLSRRFNGEAGFWSVKQGIIRFHCRCITLMNVRFLVNEKQRQRVLQTRQKNVHAFVYGFLSPPVSGLDYEVTYNPYKCEQFVTGKTPIYEAEFCRLERVGEKMLVFASQTAKRESVETCLL